MLPLFSFVIVPAALGAALASLVLPSLGGSVLHALARVLDGLMAGGDYLLEQGVAAWPLNPPGPLAVVALLFGLGLLILPRGMPLRALAPVLVALFFLTRSPSAERGAVTITWLEVGQGSATVIQTRSATLVIDTGPAWSGGANAAAFSLVPFLKAEGIERIDRLIVTHADRDHRGGVNALNDAVAIERVESGEPLADLPRATRCQAGSAWQVAGVRFEYLWPDDPASLDGNAASCVLRLRAPAGDVLFTGDIDHAIERVIAERIDRPVIALEAAHHGSRTGTGQRLLEAAAPQAAVISAGYRNAYGMPHPAVIERLRCRGIRYFDTGRQGAVQLRLTPGEAPRWRTERGGDRLLLHESPQRRRFQNAARIPYDRRIDPEASMESRQSTCGN
jgi:competence protein ComEC